MGSAMKISIETLESTNFGDHGERLRRSHAQVEGETVEDLVSRVFVKLGQKWRSHDHTDEIVIRVIDPETDPAVENPPDPWSVSGNPPAQADDGLNF